MNLKQLKKERDRLVAHIEESRQNLAAMDRVIRMFTEKGSTGVQPNGGNSVEQSSLLPNVTVEPAEPGESSSNAWLKPLVTAAINALPVEFTKTDVFNKTVELSPENKERIRDDVVAAIVWRMANRTNELETVVQGKGSKSSVYKKKL